MNTELYHYGLKGMKWGTRRWQFDDGRFNDAGKARYFGQNSSHRPDSVRVLQGDPPKKSPSGSTQETRSFDRDRAKKIAKNCAIGAAVVGGTVLVAYGGYKIHQAGGFSEVSKNLTAKMRETKLENLKLKEEFKVNMASIKSEGKQRLAEIGKETKTGLAQIKKDAKTELARIKEEGKANRDSIKKSDIDKMVEFIDPHGTINREGIIKELANGTDPNEIKSKLDKMVVSEKYAFGEGYVKLSDIKGIKSKDTEDYFKNHHFQDQPYMEQLKGIIEKGNAEKYTTIGEFTVRKDDIASQRSLERIISNRKDINDSKIGDVKSAAQIVSAYRKEHPNTTLSPSKIVANYKGAANTVASTAKSAANAAKASASATKSVANSTKSTAKSVPKLTLTPDTINSGTNFLAQATKSYQTVSQINQENARSNSKAKRGQKAVDDYTKELLRRGA